MKRPKFLVEMKHGLGDCVCMLPAVDALRIRYPDAYIAMIVMVTAMWKSLIEAPLKLIVFIF